MAPSYPSRHYHVVPASQNLIWIIPFLSLSLQSSITIGSSIVAQAVKRLLCEQGFVGTSLGSAILKSFFLMDQLLSRVIAWAQYIYIPTLLDYFQYPDSLGRK